MNAIKPELFLFTDSSVDPKSGIGVGAYLLISEDQFESITLKEKIQIQTFQNTSSTKLELETLLWALENKNLHNYKITVYTDCQNIIGLQNRQEKLEIKEYTNNKDKLINNHLLYKQFYKSIDSLDCRFVKVKGHSKNSTKDLIDKIFMLVDRSCRKALRDIV
jgi:ribonuclease HI